MAEMIKIVSQNKKAYHDYFILETYEAGIELHGTEVKSLRLGKVNLKDSWCSVVNGEMLPMPEKTPQESIESACVERVGGVYFTTADELDEYVEKTRNEKYLRKQKSL